MLRMLMELNQRGFDTREEAEDWLMDVSDVRWPYYEAFKSITRCHRIEPRRGPSADDAIYVLMCDGVPRGNPGRSGCGGCIWAPRLHPCALHDRRMALYQHDCDVGTNSVAEYRSLIRGLITALGLGIRSLRIQMDSELVLNQTCGDWATRIPAWRTKETMCRRCCMSPIGGSCLTYLVCRMHWRTD